MTEPSRPEVQNAVQKKGEGMKKTIGENFFDFLDAVVYHDKVQRYLKKGYVAVYDKREAGLNRAIQLLEEDYESLGAGETL